jgi:hypothetical protein
MNNQVQTAKFAPLVQFGGGDQCTLQISATVELGRSAGQSF